MTKDIFKRRANRLCVFFDGIGFVPVADVVEDDQPEFITNPPRMIGDDAVIYVEGEKRKVRLLKSCGVVETSMYIVDFGAEE